MSFLMILCFAVPTCFALILQFISIFNKNRVNRNLFVSVALLIQVSIVILTVLAGDMKITLGMLSPTISIKLQSDSLSRFFALLFSGMCTIVGIYSFEYMKHEKHEKFFYICFLLTVAAMNALAFAGNLVTMYMFFELVSLMSMGLVINSLSKEAIAAGIKYLFYSIGGATMGLLAIFFLRGDVAADGFIAGGSLVVENFSKSNQFMLWIIFLSVVGFTVKAGMFPLHSWLPTAHPVAPSPASAMLSGIITKAGVLSVIRIIYYVVGVEFLRGTWVQYVWLTFALITILMGSMMAYKEPLFKKRLAYSSVSQVSYVLLGLFIMNQTAFNGALLHVIFHSTIKTCLFLCAGVIIVKTGKTRVSQFQGIGKQLPIAMTCFTIVSIALVGIPPTGGFVSKWFIATGSLASQMPYFAWIAPIVLIISALLTAAYLFPIFIHGFIPDIQSEISVDDSIVIKENITEYKNIEHVGLMTVSLIILATFALIGGIFPNWFIGIFNLISGLVM